MSRYLLFSIHSGTRHEFDSAAKAAGFLHEQGFRGWEVFARVEGLPANTNGVRKVLERIGQEVWVEGR